jgi:hypothetical protein
MKKKLFKERRTLGITKDPNTKEIVIEAVEFDKETGKAKPKRKRIFKKVEE